ncbi:snaclec 1 isoform X2 [Drosophila busckii]|uniref:snaclec 1 isoform X2 n=1 Tax=Drosophila busckii TaxID=30019 RepID=UPI00083F1A94|nr:snaclec 1 isoform X2 [Drosophila busckii]
MFKLIVIICSLPLWHCQVHTSTDNPYIVTSYAKLTWFAAYEVCQRSNMILASVQGFHQNTQLLKRPLLGREKFWLGGTNMALRNSWNWSGKGVPLGYKKWANEEPCSDLTGDKACLVFGLDGKWYSEDCNSEYYFVCEKLFNESANSEQIYI